MSRLCRLLALVVCLAAPLEAQVVVHVLAPEPPPVVVTLTSPSASITVTAPETVALIADVTGGVVGGSHAVEFLANGVVIGTAMAPPYTYQWSATVPGDYAITVREVGAAPPPPPPGPVTHSAAVANAYDDAWQAAWVANGTALLAANPMKTLGKVIHIGDSLTLSQAYGAWCAGGIAKPAEDADTCAWMHAGSAGDDNGWNLAGGWAITAQDSMGWGDPRIPAMLANPRVSDAQFAVLLMNSTTANVVLADVTRVLDAGIFPVLSTVPPRNVPGYDAQYTIPFNAQIRLLAQNRKLPMIDLYAEMTADPAWSTTLISGDGIHLSAAGYTLRTQLTVWKVAELRARLFAAPPPPPPIAGDLPTRLLQAADLSYVGSFLGPTWNGSNPCDTIGYGGYGMAFNPANKSLFVIGHVQTNCVGEISIPALSLDPATRQRAAFLQRPVEVTEGKRFGDLLAGLLVYHNRLIASSRVSYDANASQNQLRKSHYVSSLDLSQQGDAQGPLEVTAVKTNYLTGYMATIPAAWQAALGGTALTGWCCGPSIVGRTSLGPAVSAFDPDALGVVDPVPGSTLLYYDDAHPTLGVWSTPTPWPPVAGQGTNPRYNGTTQIDGVAFPEWTASVLFFGVSGQGVFCYGDHTSDPAKVFTQHLFPDGSSQHWCILLPGEDGGHSFYSVDVATKGYAPYHFQVWAYDAHDLAAVKAGTKQPWEVVPYAYWPLTIPGLDWAQTMRLRSVAYDPQSNRLYLYHALSTGDTVIDVLQVQ